MIEDLIKREKEDRKLVKRALVIQFICVVTFAIAIMGVIFFLK